MKIDFFKCTQCEDVTLRARETENHYNFVYCTFCDDGSCANYIGSIEIKKED
jgi:hypothetical protein